MVIIPYERITLETGLSIEKIKKKFSSKIYKKKQGPFKFPNRPFYGLVEGNEILLVREKRIGFGSLIPIEIQMTLTEQINGTKVDIIIRLPILENIAVAFSIFMIFVLIYKQMGGYHIPLIYYVLTIIFFNIYTGKSKSILYIILDNQEDMKGV